MKRLLAALLTITIIVSIAIGMKKTVAKTEIKSQGVHHVGLAVKDLKTTSHFFVKALGFDKVDERLDYPAHFVSDGTTLITLWQIDDPKKTVPFDRKKNIGLHHLAFKLNSFEDLGVMYKKIKDWPGVEIQFSPEFVEEGPAKHMIFYEPGGIRLEFIVVPK